jgi:alpha-galactosidase
MIPWMAGPLLVMAVVAGAAPDAGVPTPEELRAVSDWWQACFPREYVAPPLPPSVRVLDASHKTVLGRSVLGSPLTLGGRTYQHGVGVDAPHRMLVVLPRPATRLTATVGVDENPDTRHGAEVGEGSCTFRVLRSGTALQATDVLTLKSGPSAIAVPLEGATSFELQVGDAGSRGWDQADWADARVEYADGTTEYLDDLARTAQAGPQVPFSFTYGGNTSGTLLATWGRQVVDTTLPDGRARRTITYRNPSDGLVCELQVTTPANQPAVEWVLSFRNEGAADSGVLENVQALDATWPVAPAAPVTLHRWRGGESSPSAFGPLRDTVEDGVSTAFGPEGGRSSNGLLPFFQVEWPGQGMTVAVGWSGQWRAQVSRVGALRVGVAIDHLRTVLHPGETVRMPRVLLVPWTGGDRQRGWNLYRQVALRYYTPRVSGQVAYPIVAHDSAYDELRGADESNQLQVIRACANLSLEGYWLDAYWFEGYFPEGVGNWALPVEKAERRADYPRGIRPLADAAHQAGLRFVLWFEPERVAPGTALDRDHPEWVLRVPGGGDGLLNLGDAQAREWMTDYLCKCVEAYALDVLRIDFNIDPLPYWRAADQPGREGVTEIAYVTGLYRMWDDVRARFPGLLMDNCASGGRRIDLETNTRSLPLWRSDYNDNNQVQGDPTADQGMTMGLTAFAPLNSGPVWRPEPYFWRCASSGGPVPYWDPRGTRYVAEDVKPAVAETRALRPYCLGDFWWLTDNEPDPKGWAAYQYHRPEQGDGIALFFRRPGSPYGALDVALRGVDVDAAYRIRVFRGYEQDIEATLTGEQLKALRMQISDPGDSALLRYELVRP